MVGDSMKKIILAGGGHGHINILKNLINNPTKDHEIILITDYKRQYYSGKKKRCRLRCRTMSLNTSD